jgi:carboxymethylenebutenolidase
LISQRYEADTSIWVLLGSDDEEVSPKVCADVLGRASTTQGRIEVVWYQGATHDFDDPGKSRQSVPGNQAAKADALRRSAGLFESLH